MKIHLCNSYALKKEKKSFGACRRFKVSYFGFENILIILKYMYKYVCLEMFRNKMEKVVD